MFFSTSCVYVQILRTRKYTQRARVYYLRAIGQREIKIRHAENIINDSSDLWYRLQRYRRLLLGVSAYAVHDVALSTESSCVCVFSSHPFWTSSSLDVPAGVTQEEGHTGFLIHLPSAVRALIFVARRIQPFLSLVDREVEFCVLTN